MTWAAVLVLSIVAGALAIRWFVNANPATLARRIRFGALLLAVLLVVGLAVVGRLPWLLGLLLPMAPLIIPVLLRRRREPAEEWEGAAGEQSKVQTAHLSMTFDHDSGELNGRVTAGSFAGRMLSEMSMAEVRSLLDEVVAGGDDESANILTSYLDRRFGGAWHDDSAHAGADRARNDDGGTMSAEEAWRVLGLSPGASKDEIRAAHRRLMKQLHPDHGGSDYLASKINEAKDVLLRA
jgi:hypothetical protein